MLKWIQRILIITVIFIVLMFIQLMDRSSINGEFTTVGDKPEYHLQVIIQNSEEYFWDAFTQGAQKAGEEASVYVEFVAVNGRNADLMGEVVEKAIYSGVDGIALQPVDTLKTNELIAYAKEQGLGVITYENQNIAIENTPFVGSNSYSIGRLSGEMAVQALLGVGNVALVINDSGMEGSVFYRNLVVQGIMESFSDYPYLNIYEVYNINKDKFEAERITSLILGKEKEINLILCLDERATPGIAQALVDNNMVGDMKLVGYGMMPQTLEYITKEVINGTVSPNAYEIGYNTVLQLGESLRKEPISDSTNTELFTIDVTTVGQYLNENPTEEGDR